MEFLHAINQSLFLFINADHDDHPSGIMIALLIAEYLTAITLVAVAVYLVWKHRYRRVICLNMLCSLLLGMTATYLIRKGWHVPVCANAAGGRGRLGCGNERGMVAGISGRALAAGYGRGAAGGFAGSFNCKVWLAPVVDALA